MDQTEIHRMAQSSNVAELKEAVKQLKVNFAFLLNKKEAYEDLILLTKNKDEIVRWRATDTLGLVFLHITDKEPAWIELIQLIENNDIGMRERAVVALCKAFPHCPDKKKAWIDLVRLTKDEMRDVRVGAVSALMNALPYTTTKKQVWHDLILLTQNEDLNIQQKALSALNKAFPYMSDKKRAWESLILQLQENARFKVAAELGQAFPHIFGMEEALEKLIELICTNDRSIWWWSVIAFGEDFPHIPDKKLAWKTLIRLANAEDFGMCWRSVVALGNAFLFISDKKQAWSDLHGLTYDRFVHWRIAEVIGNIFPQIPDKLQAWADLVRLTESGNMDVRIYANYSLGRASIFKATEAETKEILRKELENALNFFEKSLKEAPTEYNPAKFCHPFYRSLFIITYKKQVAGTEIQDYLFEAKNAVKNSVIREQLFQVVEILANALKELENAQEMDFNELKLDLNTYRRYCERAANLLIDTEEKAPMATKLIMRELPVINERIKQILSEIERKARALCKQIQYTQLADLGNQLNKAGQNLSKVLDPIALDKAMFNMQTVLSAICAKMPEEEKEDAFELIKQAKDEPCVEYRINLINMVLSKISSNIGRIIIHNLYVEEFNMVKKTQVMGGYGITAGGDVHISDVSGQVAIGKNITQTQTLSASDKKELLDCLIQFQKEATKLGIPEEELSTVNGDLNAAIKEAKKEEPDTSKIKSRFENAIDTVKEVGDTIETVSKWEWTGKIVKILGKLGLTIMV